MKTLTKFTLFGALLLTFSLLGFILPCRATGFFVYASAPSNTLGHIMLLSDGTVLASQFDGGFTGTAWYRLTPDIHGNYYDGTWSNVAPANFDYYAFSSAILKDGRLFVAGGEFGNGNGVAAEIYNPSNNTWTVVSPPSSLIDPNQTSPNTGTAQRIADANCEVLPDGRVMVIPSDPKIANGTLIFDPATTNWTNGPASLNFLGEGSVVKIPDGSILTVDANDFSSERYLPALNIWTNDASTSPTSLWAPLLPHFVDETGPAFLLPNGQAIFFGGIGQTAIYTPSGGNGPGTWTNGATIPSTNVTADAPGAMMVNGKILIATALQPYVTNNPGPTVVFPAPTTIYEYDYTAPTNSAFTPVFTVNGAPSYVNQFLDLPDGTVLFSVVTTTNLLDYQPDGSPLAAGKPTILTISTNSNGSLHLTGTLFNGISEGASYGDDHQMASDFPVVRFIDAFGNVRYGRTYNWSSTGVMTGNNVVSTDCAAPPGSSSQDLIQVVANGIGSGGVLLNPNPVVTTLNDSGAGSLRQVVSNALSSATITFAPGLSGQSITLTTGEVPLNRSVTIDASSLPAGIKINGNHNSRIFNVTGTASVILNSLTITNGFTNGASGGGIVNSATLTLTNCTLAGNSTDASSTGGAIYNVGTLTLSGCTVANNSADFAGAIQNYATCSLVNCTFTANSAFGGNGGVIDNVGANLTVTQCTFSGNSAAFAGGAIDNYVSQATLVNSILANNSGDGDFYNWSSGTVTLAGNNLVGALANVGGIEIPEGAIISADPMLGPLANNGGRTLTMMPQIGSPAIDAGNTADAASINYDQRGPGFPRVLGAAVDLGAVETAVPLTVFNNADSGYGSLRYAATYAPNNSTITFAPGLSGQTITLTGGQIALNQNLVIDGSSLSTPVVLNGNSISNIFAVAASATVTLNSLVLKNGNAGSGVTYGGAITDSGALSLNNCTLSSNTAYYGGAIFNNHGALLTLSGCTLSGNSAVYGAGIYSYNDCFITNCTVANNTASSEGTLINAFGLLNLLQCTVSSNSAGQGDGGIDNLGPAIVDNSILANNGIDLVNFANSQVTFFGTDILLSGVNNGTVVPDGTIISLDPMLGPLANNGGPTLTMLPHPGSPAINAGLTSDAAGIPYDQRGPGFPRVVGPAVDVGAVEVQTIIGTSPLLTGTAFTNGAFGFSFTNVSGASFTVFATTNIDLPLSNWSNIGPAVESPLGSGHYQFMDPPAGSSAQRFYIVRSP
jgi:hypothetical protein